MLKSRRPRQRDEAGTVTIMVALCTTILLVVAAMVVDLGLARDTRRQSQNASDASALAAGNAMYAGGPVANFAVALATAKQYATANFEVANTAWVNCTDPNHLTYTPDTTNNNTCISFDSSITPTKVRVMMPTREVPASLSAVIGVQNIPIRSYAGATITTATSQPCGLCVLGSGTHDFQNGDVTVTNADIYLNGSSDVAHNGLVSTNGHIYVEGTAGGLLSNYTPDPTIHQPAISDPLAGIPLPPDRSMLSTTTKSDPCINGPGIYTGQNLNNKVCTLQPGLYVIRSGTWDGAGNSSGTLRGNGVTLYFTCSSSANTAPQACASGQSGASLDVSGNYLVNLQAQLTTPTTNGAVQGLTIAYDRNNTSQLRMTGNGSGGFVGAIYARSSTLQVNGNGCSTTYNSMIVANDIDMNGNNSCLTARYSANQNPQPTPGAVQLYE